jgi:hypothetical protein
VSYFQNKSEIGSHKNLRNQKNEEMAEAIILDLSVVLALLPNSPLRASNIAFPLKCSSSFEKIGALLYSEI